MSTTRLVETCMTSLAENPKTSLLIEEHNNIEGLKNTICEISEVKSLFNEENLVSLAQVDHKFLDIVLLLLKEKKLSQSLNQDSFHTIINSYTFFSAASLIERFINLTFFTNQHNVFENDSKKNQFNSYFNQLLHVVSLFEGNDLHQGLYEVLRKQQPRSNKIEILLLVVNKMSDGLINVIHMRQKMCREKGGALIVLPLNAYQIMIDMKIIMPSITKLSFLHHHVEEASSIYDTNYKEKIATYLSQMPHIKDIVVRACGSVSASSYISPNEKTAPEFYTINFKKDQNIAMRQVKDGVILISQKIENDKITTYLKYRNKEYDVISISMTSLPARNKISEFTTEDLQKISAQCGNVLIDKLHEKLIKQNAIVKSALKAAFYNPTFFMTPDEIKTFKKLDRRASTYIVKDFNNIPSIINTMRTILVQEKFFNITLKAYIAGYEVYLDRAIPHNSHGYDKYPKALKNFLEEEKPNLKRVNLHNQCT